MSTLSRNTPAPVAVEAPILQYANGKSMARNAPTARFVPLIGFHIEVGKDAELDKALTAALGMAAQIEIKHQRPGGAEIVRHWYLGETVKFYPLTSGPAAATIAASVSRYAVQTAEAGIGLSWPDGEKSRMAVRGYLDVLARVGYPWLVQLSARGLMTEALLAALLDHGRACEAADLCIDRVKHPDLVLFHELALVLGPGEEETWGKGETASVVPFRSLHAAELDCEQLRGLWRPESVHAAAQADWAGVQGWAAAYAAEGENGEGR